MGTPDGRFGGVRVMSGVQEATRCAVLENLDATTTSQERNRLGQFHTPFKLTSDIIRHAAAMLPPGSPIRFLEPGFGTGSFFSALLQSPFADRVRAARGVEIDGRYEDEVRRLWAGTGLRLTIGDFTRIEPPQAEEAKFNLVVCNPPYVRHHHLSQVQKQHLRAAVAHDTGFEMNGLGGLYTYFMVLSKAWMTAGGIGAWLIPSEFMDVNYGRKVKEFLLRCVTLHAIHRCDPAEVQFEDALVSSAILFFSNSSPPQKHTVRFSSGGSLSTPKYSGDMDAEHLPHIPKWTGLPQNGRRLPWRDATETLADLFTVKRGVATGCNAFFILTPERIAAHGIPKEFLTPILPSPRKLEGSEVEADRTGLPRTTARLFLLSCHLPEDEVRRRYPALWRYLERGVAEGVHKRYLCRHRSPWYSQEARPPAPLLCTYMGRPTKNSDVPFRFILNRSAATAPNVYLMLYPKPPLNMLLRRDPAVLRVLWKALGSISAEMLTGEGRVYGGGLHKLEPKELGNVPADVIRGVLPKTVQRERQQLLFV